MIEPINLFQDPETESGIGQLARQRCIEQDKSQFKKMKLGID